MKFTKLHGYGNDYIVCETSQLEGVALPGDFVRRVCDRHLGAGADGVAIVERLTGDDASEADFSLRIINPDGSEAAMSGNGSRCAAAYLHYQELWTDDELRFQTLAGVKRFSLRERTASGVYRFEAEIGKPLFDSRSIPMLTNEPLAQVRGYPLDVSEGESVAVTALQMCNPNCCVFVEDFDLVDWRRLGSLIEPHHAFPNRTNVEFIKVRDRRTIEVRVWERGVGETLSSGTGACAAAVASIINERTDHHITVEMPGGTLEVVWRDNGEVMLTGTAEVIYRGEWLGEK